MKDRYLFKAKQKKLAKLSSLRCVINQKVRSKNDRG